MKSRKPFSRRNSLFWNPSGKSWPVVSFTTLGPAKAIRAFGSAILISPSIANEAVVPPVVGSVHNEIYGNLASDKSFNLAEV